MKIKIEDAKFEQGRNGLVIYLTSEQLSFVSLFSAKGYYATRKQSGRRGERPRHVSSIFRKELDDRL
jgi:heme/copper-type cytochrome/quinol oxidase subunit 3